jgi:hypothetical protein
MLQFINNAKDITPIPTVNHNLTRDILNLTISCKKEGEVQEITFLVSWSIEWSNYILTHEEQSYLPDFSEETKKCCTVVRILLIMGIFSIDDITFNEIEYREGHIQNSPLPLELCLLSHIEFADVFVPTLEFPFILTKLETTVEELTQETE